jgi:DNA (cytosine-5)-methyltransferase 1
MPGVVARPNLSLVIPYRRGKAKTTDEPLHTLATHDSAGLLAESTVDIDECRFRMLKPREHGRAQRFPDSYLLTELPDVVGVSQDGVLIHLGA